MEAILMMEGESFLFNLHEVKELKNIVSPPLSHDRLKQHADATGFSDLLNWSKDERPDGKIIYYRDVDGGKIRIIYPNTVSDIKTEVILTDHENRERSLILESNNWCTQEAVICLLLSSDSWFDGTRFVGFPESLTREAIVNEFTD